jgi:hypothetical protein
MGDIPEAIIKYKGVFNYDQLLTLTYNWFVDQKFEVQEDNFKQASTSPKGTYQEICWKAERKVNQFLIYKLKIDFRIWDMKPVEVIKDGTKQVVQMAKLRIIIDGDLIKDYQNIFKGSKWNELLGDLFTKFVYKMDIGAIHEDTLYYWSYKLHGKLKEFLDMEAQVNTFEGRA